MVKYSAPILTALLLVVATVSCRACIALAQDANGNPVPTIISGEQAVIIWDEAHKTEHFIRRADIATTGTSVGFIVPTPQTPTLVEADPLIFNFAAEDAAPKEIGPTVRVTPLDILYGLTHAFEVKGVFTTITSQLAIAATGEEDRVQVLSETDVADYHATVLAAEDTASLAQWLKENGYTWKPEDDAWLQPYLAAKWKITAFKLNQTLADRNSGSVQSRAIRMSFTTDQPFFPYSEPGDVAQDKAAATGYRTLDVAFLSNERMAGKLADGHAWPGELLYAGKMETPYQAAQIIALAKFDPAKDSVSTPTVLTYFIDKSSPRPGTADLNFSPDQDPSSFRKTIVDSNLPPNIEIDWTSPLADLSVLLLIAGPIGLFVWLHSLDRKRSARVDIAQP